MTNLRRHACISKFASSIVLLKRLSATLTEVVAPRVNCRLNVTAVEL